MNATMSPMSSVGSSWLSVPSPYPGATTVSTPNTRAAASSSTRRIAASSSRDETGTPELFPASPFVAQNKSAGIPASAYLAMVPPTQNVSSSGCAKIQPSRWFNVRLAPVPAAAEQAENEQEHVEQVEIDRHRSWHVVVLPELTGPHDAPRVEDQQSREDHHAHGGNPQRSARTRDEEVDHACDEQHHEADHEEAAPRAEVAFAVHRVDRQPAERGRRQHRRLPHDAGRARLRDGEKRRDVDAFDEREQKRENQILRKIARGSHRHHQRNEHRDEGDE